MPAFPQVQIYESLLLASVFAFVALVVYLVGRYFTGRPPREDARLKQISLRFAF